MSDEEGSVDSPTVVSAAPVLADEGDICGDGSILKEIITKGSGWQKPPKGAEVSVHYVGTLTDGKKFDSSRDRGDHFKFKLGQASVIKGWDEGVATMLKGEVSKFTIQSAKAYGTTGQGSIPPNATLIFEIELFSWDCDTDVSDAKDKSIVKTTLKSGEGYSQPKDLAVVQAHVVLTHEDGTSISTTRTEGAGPQQFVIDSGALPTGVDTVLKSMKKGEHATAVIKAQHAYAATGNSTLGVPPNTTVVAEVELVDFVNEKESWELKGDEQLHASDKYREQGNELFKAGDLARAVRRYQTALKAVESEYELKEDAQKALGKTKKVLANSNLAAVYLKQGNFKEAAESAGKAIELDSSNVKALFRRGSAFVELGDFDAARKDLKKVLELEPSNAAAAAALRTIAQRSAAQRESDKKRYGGMFEKLAKMEEHDKKKAAEAAAKAAAAAPAPAPSTDAAVAMDASEGSSPAPAVSTETAEMDTASA